MRHKHKGNRLSRAADQRRALLRGLVTSLFQHDSITTTLPKAREARRLAERLITLAKRGDLHARREVLKHVYKLDGIDEDPPVVRRLLEEIAPRYENRDGGYTTIIRAGFRRGDAAPMAVLKLVD